MLTIKVYSEELEGPPFLFFIDIAYKTVIIKYRHFLLSEILFLMNCYPC